MLVCRPRPHRPTGFSFPSILPIRPTSTTVSNEGRAPASASPSQDSIFTAPESPWDHLFSDIEPSHPTQRRQLPAADNATCASQHRHHGQNARSKGSLARQPIMQRKSVVRQQRASLTKREMSVFDEMFSMIFDAVGKKDGKAKGSRAASASASAKASTHAASATPLSPSIGHAGSPLNDIFHTLRRRASRVQWTTAIDEELDRKKETMELFNTDHALLQYVTLELFRETQRWDEEATKAAPGEKGSGAVEAGASEDASATSSTPIPEPTLTTGEHPIHPSIYPHLIAHAMRLFRTTYSNPSLSLSIFSHAARASIPSYVFGCTAPAYNELIEAKWKGWGDLEGVCSALEEMKANGVKMDGRTRIVVETVRREVGEARPMEFGGSMEKGREDANVDPLARRVWKTLEEVEVMGLLHRMEQLALRDPPRTSASSPHEESWKRAALQPGKDDGWGFDEWDTAAATKKRGRAKGKVQPRMLSVS